MISQKVNHMKIKMRMVLYKENNIRLRAAEHRQYLWESIIASLLVLPGNHVIEHRSGPPTLALVTARPY